MREEKESSAMVDSASRDSASSPGPFIFRQYTFREIVTPSKQGPITIKEVSFSECRPQPLSSTFRSRATPPYKRAKVEPILYNQKKTRTSRRCPKIQSHNEQAKQVKELHWKYIFIIALLPLPILIGLLSHIWPVYEYEDSGQDQLLSDDSIQHQWNLNRLQETLRRKVFGQEAAIKSVVKILDEFLNKNMAKEKERPVILISGLSGVGKSLISSLVSDTFPGPGKTKLVVPPAFSAELTLKEFSETGLNLVVVDSLGPLSITDGIKWIRSLFNEAVWHNKQIIVILVYDAKGNIADAADDMPSNLKATSKALHEKLTSFGLNSHRVHLDPLTKEHVEDCIRIALQNRGLQNDPNIEKFVKHISDHIDYKREGCKSVWRHCASVDF